MRKSTVKKTVTKAPVNKKEIVKAETVAAVKTEEPKTEAVEAETVEAKTEEKAVEAEATAAAKTVEKPAAKKTAAKKTTTAKATAEKKAPAKRATKVAAVKTEVSVQFAGKEYTTERLVEIAKDVWQYDLGNAPEEFKSVELYVKPEESCLHPVVNQKGSTFPISTDQSIRIKSCASMVFTTGIPALQPLVMAV